MNGSNAEELEVEDDVIDDDQLAGELEQLEGELDQLEGGSEIQLIDPDELAPAPAEVVRQRGGNRVGWFVAGAAAILLLGLIFKFGRKDGDTDEPEEKKEPANDPNVINLDPGSPANFELKVFPDQLRVSKVTQDNVVFSPNILIKRYEGIPTAEQQASIMNWLAERTPDGSNYQVRAQTSAGSIAHGAVTWLEEAIEAQGWTLQQTVRE